MVRSLFAAALIALSAPLAAQDKPAPSPNEIVNAAPAQDWVAIPLENLLVMELAPDRDGKPRQVVIQLMPEPFSQGWVENIRTLARARWYDGVSINRVQDNYVVQWGDPAHDNAESVEAETKTLPEGLNVMEEEDYISAVKAFDLNLRDDDNSRTWDNYASHTAFLDGWPTAWTPGTLVVRNMTRNYRPSVITWPVHCYGMVGVGRGMSPDTGTGAELYTVIGHAPRHLDRNIALVGRVIDGMEHLSSLPRGSGQLGFYTEEEADLRTPIRSIRVASDLLEDAPASSSEAVGQQKRPRFEYLSTESETFARYAEARSNRRDPFFIVPAGGADICNIPVPVRKIAGE